MIRYEDLVTNPSVTLKRIGRLVGEDLSCVTKAVSAKEAIHAGHTVGGCRVRMSRNIQLRADFAWIDELPKKERKLFWCTAGWLARLYGYARQPPDYGMRTSQL